MKKVLAGLLLSSFLVIPLITMAQLATIPEKSIGIEGMMDIIDTAAQWLFNILVVAATLVVLWGALQFLFSGGDPEKVNQARDRIIYGLIGYGLALFSKAIISLFESFINIAA